MEHEAIAFKATSGLANEPTTRPNTAAAGRPRIKRSEDTLELPELVGETRRPSISRRSGYLIALNPPV